MEAEIKPRDIAPQSPIKIRAGLKLKQKKGILIHPIKLAGAIELAPLSGLSDLICDLTATGTTLKDNGFLFRTTPSKIRGSQILAEITKDRGIRSVAISYSRDNDYEKFAKAYSEILNKNNIKTSLL